MNTKHQIALYHSLKNMGNNLIKSEDEESEKKGLIDKIDELKRVILSSTNLDTTNPPPVSNTLPLILFNFSWISHYEILIEKENG